jgi:hypothetical protein
MNTSILKVVGALGGGTLLLGSLATPPQETVAPVETATVPAVVPTKANALPDVQSAANTETVAPAVSRNVESKPAAVAQPVVKKVETVPAPTQPKASSDCHPGYSGCLKTNAGDYDCRGGSGNGPNYTGPVSVYGSDPFDLDRDGDGQGCDR